MEATQSTKPAFAWQRLVVGVVVLAIVVFVVLHFGEATRLWELLRHADPVWIVAAIGLQAGTYACVGGVLQRALVSEHVTLPVRQLFLLAIAKQFVTQAVPSIGLSGNVMMIRGLENDGVPRPLAVRVVMVSLLSYYAAYAISLSVAIVILWQQRELMTGMLLALTVLLVLMSAFSAGILLLGDQAQRILPARAMRWLREHEFADVLAAPRVAGWNGRLISGTTLLQMGVFALDAITLWVCGQAIGIDLEPTVAFASLVAATAVASVGMVPGGMGTFEGTCIALLHSHGVDWEAAIAASLLLRGFTFWLPMLPGLWLAKREL